MKPVKQRAEEMGIAGIVLLMLAAVIFTVFVIYIKAPQEVGVPVPSEPRVIPASGVDGFKVDEDVCHKFNVGISVAPDVGFVYTLTRNVGGVVESVIINSDTDGGIINKDFNRHFFNTVDGQAPEPAYVTDSGWKCVKEKAK